MKNQKPLSQKLYELRKEHNFNIAPPSPEQSRSAVQRSTLWKTALISQATTQSAKYAGSITLTQGNL